MTGPDRALRGRRLGDRRIRIERPHTEYFRYTGPHQLIAREAASRPRTRTGRALARARAILFGRPLSTHEEIGERLSKRKALAIFSSDAISSSAYATEEILRVLVLAGAAALFASIAVSVAIAVLLTVVALSYRQVCRAFPNGGGAYAVARAELAPIFGLVAAAALLIDYVMTVAVSTSSALDQLASLAPAAAPFKVEIAVAVITLMTIANLRGLRESGNIFAVPTYVFVVLALGVVAIGLGHIVTGTVVPLPPQPNAVALGADSLGLFLLLRAFASGSVALTGVEAIANGVPAFKPPEPRNAANTMIAMAALLGVTFIGISVVATAYGVVPSVGGSPSVVALVAGAAYGDGTVLQGLFLVATMLILFLAANTSYNAFPRLAAILAEDGYMPRQFAFRGDRLAYSWGIVLLATIAAGLIALFGGTTTLLIPLYAVGVFVCFTLSQAGMVLHWLRRRDAGWRRRLVTNGLGALLTGIVLVIVVYEKFLGGAYLVVILIPTLVGIMLFIERQYARSAAQLEVRPDAAIPGPHREERVIVPVAKIDRSVVNAINTGRSISPHVQAVLVSDDPAAAAELRDRWARQVPNVPLVVVESPYRALVGPVLAYLDVLDASRPDDSEAPITFVVIPEYVARSWWERLLYNQSAKPLRTALLGRPHTVVVNVPYRRESVAATRDGPRSGRGARGGQCGPFSRSGAGPSSEPSGPPRGRPRTPGSRRRRTP
ncbi:MAG TPA: APC family permease [Candidatus Limnocylindrales bacterium]|nr:APC family permease [Candidatus Limnocylindrales bacterium]